MTAEQREVIPNRPSHIANYLELTRAILGWRPPEVAAIEARNWARRANNSRIKDGVLEPFTAEQSQAEQGDYFTIHVEPIQLPETFAQIKADPQKAEAFIQFMDTQLETVAPRVRHILQLRYGLEDGRSRAREEVGRYFGVTDERIRQIESKALARLRREPRAQVIKHVLGQLAPVFNPNPRA